jgi:hypothetical protein
MPVTRRRRSNPDQPENNNHLDDQTESSVESLSAEQQEAALPADKENVIVPAPERTENMSFSPTAPALSPAPMSNGDRVERQDYTPSIEGGRRTARGELFRRPPQIPAPSSAAAYPSSAPLQAPTHEITLPLGNLLHLAYNPGYTGADEARSMLLHQLAEESKAGGRARCWNCGSIAIVYDRWNTRSKTFGEVGIAFCEICGVWSVM